MSAMTSAAASGQATPYAFDVEDVEYVQHKTGPLLMRLFKPRGKGPFPIMVDLHGGAWCNGDRLNDTPINEALARSGVLVAALDFRMPPAAAYPASIADINYAIRWLKSRATSLNARADRIGVVGISSGGHQGMLAAMRPEDSRYKAIPNPEGSNADARVNCVVMLWPVIDPLGRYQYCKKLIAENAPRAPQVDSVVPSHDKYWGTEAAMSEGAPSVALEKGEKVDMPPVLYVQGTADLMHPRPHLDRFVENYRKRGGQVDLSLYDGEVAGFMVRDTKNPANASNAFAKMIEFVHRHLG